MNEVIIAIIVGLWSGLLGSVLGPVVIHRLRSRERKEEREREIHKELRQMIEERLEECGRSPSTAFRIHADIRHKKLSPFDAYKDATLRKADRDRPRHRWQPYRITDSALRSLAEQLNDRLNDFDSYLVSVMTLGFDEWWAGVAEKEEALRQTERQARLRLDELCW